jgi:hypothetical protein
MSYLLVTLCCAFAALGSFLFGYDSGVISSSIEQDAFLRYFGSPGLSDAASGGIISSYTGAPARIHLDLSPTRISLTNLANRRRNIRVPSRTLHLGFLWSPHGHFHRWSTSHIRCSTAGWCSYSRDADRWPIYRGLGHWAYVGYDSRLLCMSTTISLQLYPQSHPFHGLT